MLCVEQALRFSLSFSLDPLTYHQGENKHDVLLHPGIKRDAAQSLGLLADFCFTEPFIRYLTISMQIGSQPLFALCFTKQ